MTNQDIAVPDDSLITRAGDLLHPDDFDDTMRAAIAELDAAAGDAAAALRADSSDKAYAADWRDWCAFTTEFRIPRLGVSSGTLYAFVEWLWERPGWKAGTKLAPTTIDGRLSGVVVTARDRYKVKLPRDVAANARRLLAHRVKELAVSGEQRGRGKAAPLRPDHLGRALAELPPTPDGVRDRAIVLVHFNIAGREHELSHLLVRDFAFDDGGMDVDVRVSKTHPRKVFIPGCARDGAEGPGRSLAPELCAVCSTRAWFELAGIADDPGGRAWRRCHARWKTPMLGHSLSAEAIGDVIERTGARTDGPRLTGHSPRRGFAQAARDAGADRERIAKQGGWVAGSRAMEGYFEEADRRANNAAAGLLAPSPKI